MEFDYPLPERWKWAPLGELADTRGRAIVSGPFGSNISSKFFVQEGVPVIRGNNLTTNSQKFVDDGFVFVTPEKAKDLGNVDAVRDDIIFTAAGSLGQVGIIPERTRFPLYIISNKQMRVRLNRDLIDPLFAFQWLSSPPMVEFIQRQNTGSSVPLINLSIVRGLPVPLPPLAEQKAIAAVLGSLDDKIELNRRMNATLEGMARALFQSWFIDFDPVRAKLDGRKPTGLGEATADLFPRSFHDSALGHIPAGWQVKPLGELADVNWGDTNTTKKSYVSEGFTAYSAAGPDGFLPYHDYDRTGVVVSAIGSAGLSWLAIGRWSCIKNTIRFWATAPGISTEYLYQFTKGQEKWPMRGSVQSFISQGDARAIRVLAPANGLAERYAEMVRPWLAKIHANKAESRTLATLRDTLLPKLLNGEIKAGSAVTMPP